MVRYLDSLGQYSLSYYVMLRNTGKVTLKIQARKKAFILGSTAMKHKNEVLFLSGDKLSETF